MKVISSKYLSVLLIFCTLSATLMSQEITSDSLQKLFLKAETSRNAKPLIQLAQEKLSKTPSVSMKIGKFTYKLANLWEDKKLEIESNLVLGYAYSKFERYRDGAVYMFMAKHLANQIQDQDILKSTTKKLAEYYFDAELFNESYQAYQEIYEKESNGISYLLKFAKAAYYLKEYDKSILYLKEALLKAQQKEDNNLLAIIYTELGESYDANKNHTSALTYYNSAQLIYKTRQLSYELGDLQLRIGKLSLLFDPQAALESFEFSIDIARKINDNELLVNAINNKTAFLMDNNNIIESRRTLEAINLVDSIEIGQKNSLRYYNLLNQVYSLSSMHESALIALLKYSKFKAYQDSISIHKLEITAKKQSDILLARQSLGEILNREAIKKSNFFTNNIVFILAFSFILVSILLYIISSIRKKFQIKVKEAKDKENAYKFKLKDFESKLKTGINTQTVDIKEELSKRTAIDVDLKKALKKAEDANYLKNAFLSNMSHEIRTPLNGIIGFSNLLLTELSLMENQELYEYASGIQQSGDRLLNLLNNIIDISRIEANDLEVKLTICDVNETMRKVSDLFKFKANEKGLKFNLILNEIPTTMADPNSLTKVFSDIIDNAVKYTDKGFINVVTDYDPNKKKIVISIKDTGIGIDKSYLNHIFEAFRQESLGYSRNYQGAGLGLPLAKRLTDLMKGEIEIESTKGKGTTVKIYFDAVTVEDSVNPSVAIPDKIVSLEDRNEDEKIKIFIVEDDRMNRLVLQKMLGNVGINTLAEDGEESLKIIEEAYNKGEFFDVMLFDINLPAPWDGIKLMHEIKSRWKEYRYIPFIAQTAYAMKGDKERLMEAGFDNYLPKPVNKKEMINMLFNQIENQKRINSH